MYLSPLKAYTQRKYQNQNGKERLMYLYNSSFETVYQVDHDTRGFIVCLSNSWEGIC